MDSLRNFDETAALASVGLTPGSVKRMIAREDVRADRARSWRFDGNGCELQSARRGAMPATIGHWIGIEAMRRKLRAVLQRPVAAAH
jgi:hypothetical protein